MKINWIQPAEKVALNYSEIVKLEYELRNHLLRCLIRDAEHLVDYIGNIELNFELDSGTFALHQNTPEPYISLIGPQIDSFNFIGNRKRKTTTLARLKV